ncbi:peroxisome proliferator-activated receptor gamma coactivator-related protein 1 [Tachyglossus aculeatus]|uniref:peroxisome proliferator-activated receptor gamma coactivator-related protein 1 n=1 Tax=Tachyglossus aculeatus TaxID=9261 RepID=UPI0018F4035C|nr:peroxisome proliferator-activated receptor gamma coactivator-related protein 1 [Tachyglossus aculeatus]
MAARRARGDGAAPPQGGGPAGAKREPAPPRTRDTAAEAAQDPLPKEEDASYISVSDLALSSLDSEEILGTMQSYMDATVISIIEDFGNLNENKLMLDEQNEVSLLTALTEILGNTDDESLSPFDSLPDSELLVSPRESSSLQKLLSLTRTPTEGDLAPEDQRGAKTSGSGASAHGKVDLCLTDTAWELPSPLFPESSSPKAPGRKPGRPRPRWGHTGPCPPQRSDGEEEEAASPGPCLESCLESCGSPSWAPELDGAQDFPMHLASPEAEEAVWQPPCSTPRSEAADESICSLSELVRAMHPYSLPALATELGPADEELLGGGVVLEIVGHGDTSGGTLEIPVVVRPLLPEDQDPFPVPLLPVPALESEGATEPGPGEAERGPPQAALAPEREDPGASREPESVGEPPGSPGGTALSAPPASPKPPRPRRGRRKKSEAQVLTEEGPSGRRLRSSSRLQPPARPSVQVSDFLERQLEESQREARAPRPRGRPRVRPAEAAAGRRPSPGRMERAPEPGPAPQSPARPLPPDGGEQQQPPEPGEGPPGVAPRSPEQPPAEVPGPRGRPDAPRAEAKPRPLSLSEYRQRRRQRQASERGAEPRPVAGRWPSLPEPPTELAEIPCLLARPCRGVEKPTPPKAPQASPPVESPPQRSVSPPSLEEPPPLDEPALLPPIGLAGDLSGLTPPSANPLPPARPVGPPQVPLMVSPPAAEQGAPGLPPAPLPPPLLPMPLAPAMMPYAPDPYPLYAPPPSWPCYPPPPAVGYPCLPAPSGLPPAAGTSNSFHMPPVPSVPWAPPPVPGPAYGSGGPYGPACWTPGPQQPYWAAMPPPPVPPPSMVHGVPPPRPGPDGFPASSPQSALPPQLEPLTPIGVPPLAPASPARKPEATARGATHTTPPVAEINPDPVPPEHPASKQPSPGGRSGGSKPTSGGPLLDLATQVPGPKRKAPAAEVPGPQLAERAAQAGPGEPSPPPKSKAGPGPGKCPVPKPLGVRPAHLRKLVFPPALQARGTEDVVQAFISEIGIEASDLSSLLEQFEKSEAKKEAPCLASAADTPAVGNSGGAETPQEKRLLDRLQAPELANVAGLTPPATPPHQLWKPLAAVSLLGKPKSPRPAAAQEGASNPTGAETKGLPPSRPRSKLLASIPVHVGSGDHDYCIVGPAPAPAQGVGSRWNVKHHQDITIKPILSLSRPGPQPGETRREQLDHRTSEKREVGPPAPAPSVLLSPEASPGREEDHPRTHPALPAGTRGPVRCYRRRRDSTSPAGPAWQGRRARGSRSFGSCSNGASEASSVSSSASSSSSSSSSRSRSRSLSPPPKRWRRYRSRRSCSSRSSSRSSCGSWDRARRRSSSSSSSSSSAASSLSYSSSSSSRSRSRSPSPRQRSNRRRRYDYYDSQDHYQRQRILQKERAIEERRVVFVGKIPGRMTRAELKHRFSVFGEIEECTIHFRFEGDNYGFVTYRYAEEAFAAIESGHKLRRADEQPFDLCFGGRRQFCKRNYADLDSNREDFDPAPVKSKFDSLDFDTLLKQAQKSLRR